MFFYLKLVKRDDFEIKTLRLSSNPLVDRPQRKSNELEQNFNALEFILVSRVFKGAGLFFKHKRNLVTKNFAAM